jgi:formate-dependent nitrite reductase membrane component NrfD
MNFKAEVDSLLRWTATFVFFNSGLLACCMYKTMQNEQCSQYLQATTFNLGKFWLAIGVVLLTVCIPMEIVDYVAKRRAVRASRWHVF